MCARATATARGPRTRRPSVAGGEHATPTSLTQTEERPPSRHRVRPRRCRIVVPGALNKINHRNNQWREAERGPGRGGRRVKAPTLPLRRRVRAPAREAARKSKAVAGGQGRTVVDRSADPVREKCPHTLRRSDRRDSREHQGVGLDDAGAVSQTGDLWLLGKHRLLCGDSTVATDVERDRQLIIGQEVRDLLAERTQGLTDPDDAPAAPEHPVSQTGDLWLLGKHRLLCGDSTVATDVERVLGGVAPHLMVTDPPYCSGGFQERGKAA